jgi:Kef-type K+ transport system membrane component KefB
METGHTLLFLIVIIAAAKVGGELAERLGQPAVLGELVVGVLLGLTPLRSAADSSAIVFLASIGIMLLLFEAGLDSELHEFPQVAVSATLVAMIGVFAPLVGGAAVAYVLTHDLHQALFLGAVLTATSVGITARVLSDLQAARSREAKIILGAAVIDDILGLLLLSLVLQFTANAIPSVWRVIATTGLATGLLVAAVLIGIRLAPPLVGLTQRLRTRGILVTTAFLFCLALAGLAKVIGLAEIVGAFAAGLVLARTQDRTDIQRQIRPITDIFIPVFFVLVGLHVNLATVNPLDAGHRHAALIGAALLVIAVLGKLLAGAGVRRKGVSRLAVGVGMIPRGEVGLIFASVGLREGVIQGDLYAQVVMIVFVSTLIAPSWLKRIMSRTASPIKTSPG